MEQETKVEAEIPFTSATATVAVTSKRGGAVRRRWSGEKKKQKKRKQPR